MVVSEEAHSHFTRWLMEQYRRLLAAGDGQWWAAWHDGEPVATAGIFWHGELLRFQQILTAEHARGTGFASGLLAEMLRGHRDRGKAVIVAESGSRAGRIYRRLGFEAAGVQEALVGR
jgi:predicted GNAT family acetyltransferase